MSYSIMILSIILSSATCLDGDVEKQETAKAIVLPSVYEGHRFFVTPVTEDGRQIKLFTDTGGGLFLLKSAAKRLGLEALTVADLRAHGFKTSPEMEAHAPPDMQFALLPEFREDASIPAPVTPLGDAAFIMPMSESMEAGLDEQLMFGDGMLGTPWFAGRVWTFDYAKKRLVLWSAGNLPKPQNGKRMNLGFQTDEDGMPTSSHPRIQMVVDGETIEMLFDTGATTSLSEEALEVVGDGAAKVRATCFIAEQVFNRWRERHPDWRVIENAETYSGQAMIEARDVTIAGHTIDRVWFTRRTEENFIWMSQFMDKPVVGAIGGNVLRHFRITVDYPNKVALFEPIKQ